MLGFDSLHVDYLFAQFPSVRGREKEMLSLLAALPGLQLILVEGPTSFQPPAKQQSEMETLDICALGVKSLNNAM